jgi:hypothetical protein
MRRTNFRGVPCPKCQRKGLSYAPHPHAFGWKDYGHAYCRYCHTRFTVKDPAPEKGEPEK